MTEPQARLALAQFEQDIVQALAFAKAGTVETLIVDGGALATDIITIVTLADSENKNNTYRYAGRNAYIRNLFNQLNEAGINVVWTSKAKPVWAGNQRVPGLWQPDCYEDVPFMVDVNVQFKMEPSPQGANFYGEVGTNAFNAALVGKRFANLDWGILMTLLGRGERQTWAAGMPDSAKAAPGRLPAGDRTAQGRPEACVKAASRGFADFREAQP